MEAYEMPLKKTRTQRRAISNLFESIFTERKETSRIYLKHLNSLKRQNHISLLISEKREKIINKDVIHSRFGHDYDKLYDTSPRTKKAKLKSVRTSSKTSLAMIENKINTNPSLYKSSTIDSKKSILKENYHSGLLYKKCIIKNNLKNIFPKIRKNSIN